MIKTLYACLLATLCVIPATSADIQYGIDVDQTELLFMMGQFSRGTDLELGRSGSGDHSQAAHHYRKAAVLGFPPAQYVLGRHYEQGLGFPRDYTQAYVWYSLAAIRGDANAASSRDLTARHLNDEGLREARRLVKILQEFLP